MKKLIIVWGLCPFFSPLLILNGPVVVREYGLYKNNLLKNFRALFYGPV